MSILLLAGDAATNITRRVESLRRVELLKSILMINIDLREHYSDANTALQEHHYDKKKALTRHYYDNSMQAGSLAGGFIPSCCIHRR